jgi:Winged helix DNA-binding domain
LTVRGPMVDSKHAYVLVRDWLGEPKPVDRDAALADLARRYLAGHGPASDRDLARWAGLPLRDVRAGLSAIGSDIDELGDGLVDLARRAPAEELPPPRLLGPYDPLLLGWTSREDVLGPHQQLVTVNGLFRPFALVRGRAAASWGMPQGEVVIEPFGRLRKADAAALEREAEDVARFFSER